MTAYRELIDRLDGATFADPIAELKMVGLVLGDDERGFAERNGCLIDGSLYDFTLVIDDAINLAERALPDCRVTLSGGGCEWEAQVERYKVRVIGKPPIVGKASAKTASLAISIALLRALETQTFGKQGERDAV